MSAREFGGTVPPQVPPGGYGIYLTDSYPSRYILFADLDGDKDFDQGETVEEINFEGGVRITSLSGSPLRIVFSPPDPTVTINPTINPSAPAVITLGGKKTVRVNSAGLIAIE